MPKKSKYGEPLKRLGADIPESLKVWFTEQIQKVNTEDLQIRRVNNTEGLIALLLLAKKHDVEFRELLIRG